jgi:hypothetical protein
MTHARSKDETMSGEPSLVMNGAKTDRRLREAVQTIVTRCLPRITASWRGGRTT